MFLNTLGFASDSSITTAANCFDEFGVNLGDQRGRNEPPNKLSDKHLLIIRDHIMSYNPSISHYRREHAPKRLYLLSYLTITEMFDDYKKQCIKHNHDPVSYPRYAKEVSSLNISFAKLGDERGEVCEEHKIHIKVSSSTLIENGNTDDRKRKRCEENKIVRNFKEIVCSDESYEKCEMFSRHNQYKNEGKV